MYCTVHDLGHLTSDQTNSFVFFFSVVGQKEVCYCYLQNKSVSWTVPVGVQTVQTPRDY